MSISTIIKLGLGKRKKDKVTPANLVPNVTTFETSLELSFLAQDGSTTYYTLDGSTPTALKTKYVNSFTIISTTTIKWISVLSPYTNSNVMTKTITKL